VQTHSRATALAQNVSPKSHTQCISIYKVRKGGGEREREREERERDRARERESERARERER